MKSNIVTVNGENYEYSFNCTKCSEYIILKTGYGRYGALGSFECPFCGEKYYAGIDDNANVPHVYLTSAGGVKRNLIMTGHELDKDLFERAYQKLGEVVQLMRSKGFMVVGSKNLWDAEYCYKRLDEARDKEIINFIKGKFTLMLKEDEFDDEKLIRLIGELIEICG